MLAAPLAVLEWAAAARTALQAAVFPAVDARGLLPPNALLPFPGTRLLAPFGRVGLGVDRHHARGRRWRWPHGRRLRFPWGQARRRLGDAPSRGQQSEGDELGISLAQAWRLRFIQLTPHARVDQSIYRLRLPWVHGRLAYHHEGARASYRF